MEQDICRPPLTSVCKEKVWEICVHQQRLALGHLIHFLCHSLTWGLVSGSPSPATVLGQAFVSFVSQIQALSYTVQGLASSRLWINTSDFVDSYIVQKPVY